MRPKETQKRQKKQVILAKRSLQSQSIWPSSTSTTHEQLGIPLLPFVVKSFAAGIQRAYRLVWATEPTDATNNSRVVKLWGKEQAAV